jgi:hypothetical protein
MTGLLKVERGGERREKGEKNLRKKKSFKVLQ